MASKKFNFSQVENAPAVQSATETMAKAFENGNGNVNGNGNANENATPAVQSTSLPLPLTGGDKRGGSGSASVMTSIEALAARHLQIMSEYNGARCQAINLKTFPAAADWELKEILEKFKDNCQPGTPKLTKGALAEQLLIDAVHDLYIKICK